jgi:hypothetical protein
MRRGTKRRGGFRVAIDVIEAALRARGVVRPRDFDRPLNSHNWVNIPTGVSMARWAPALFGPIGERPHDTALASFRGHCPVVGFESALWIAGYILEEPRPVQLVVPRGSRKTRHSEPPIEFHWSDVRDDEEHERDLYGIRVRVHSPARALVDIVRTRAPQNWPQIDPRLFPRERVLRLASQLRAARLLSAWLAAQTRGAPASIPPAP